MKSMSELLALSVEELHKLLEDTRRELFHVKTKVRVGELKNVSAAKPLKALIARVLTVMKQKRKV